MLRTHGYFDKGKRCYGAHNWGEPRVERMSQASYRLISGVNTDVFTSWVQEILLPNLSKKRAIGMDNANFHKGKDMQKMQVIKWDQAKHIGRTLTCSIDHLF